MKLLGSSNDGHIVELSQKEYNAYICLQNAVSGMLQSTSGKDFYSPRFGRTTGHDLSAALLAVARFCELQFEVNTLREIVGELQGCLTDDDGEVHRNTGAQND